MAKKLFGYGDFYCSHCGARAEAGVKKCPACGSLYSGKRKYAGIPALGAGGIGWSDRTKDPRFARYNKNYRIYSYIWATALSILVPIVLLATGDLDWDNEGKLVILVIISVFWVFALGFLFLNRERNEPDWEGIVEQKSYGQRKRSNKKGSNWYTEYVVSIRCSDGSIRTLKYEDDSTKYDYFREGEHLRYHGNKHLKYIEKYDKTNDEILFCAKCGWMNDVRGNYCSACGCPLLKGQPIQAKTANETL